MRFWRFTLTTTHYILLGSAGLISGVLNAVAGGGSLVLFPALLACGLPLLAANVTNSVATFPGFIGGLLGFKAEIRAQLPRLPRLLLATLFGSTLGCGLLLVLPDAAFDRVVPALVLFASVLLPLQPLIQKRISVPADLTGPQGVKPATVIAVFFATIYGGYFGGALGVIILAALAWTLSDTLRRLNGLKVALSSFDSLISVIIFGLFGPVNWGAVLLITPASLLGGYLGARIARRINDRVLRWGVALYGLAVAIYLAVK